MNRDFKKRLKFILLEIMLLILLRVYGLHKFIIGV